MTCSSPHITRELTELSKELESRGEAPEALLGRAEVAEASGKMTEARKLFDVRRIAPVAKTREVAVSTALASVLRCGLPIHLQHPTARFSNKATNQVEIIDLDSGGCPLHRLVDALENGRNQSPGPAQDSRSSP